MNVALVLLIAWTASDLIRSMAINVARSEGNRIIEGGVAGTSLSKPCTEAVSLLKTASQDPSVDKHEVFKALRTIQKENLPVRTTRRPATQLALMHCFVC